MVERDGEAACVSTYALVLALCQLDRLCALRVPALANQPVVPIGTEPIGELLEAMSPPASTTVISAPAGIACCGSSAHDGAAYGYLYETVSLHFLLVDEDWVEVGRFESDSADWVVGQEFVDEHGRRFAIAAIVPNPEPESAVEATWTVEPA